MASFEQPADADTPVAWENVPCAELTAEQMAVGVRIGALTTRRQLNRVEELACEAILAKATPYLRCHSSLSDEEWQAEAAATGGAIARRPLDTVLLPKAGTCTDVSVGIMACDNELLATLPGPGRSAESTQAFGLALHFTGKVRSSGRGEIATLARVIAYYVAPDAAERPYAPLRRKLGDLGEQLSPQQITDTLVRLSRGRAVAVEQYGLQHPYSAGAVGMGKNMTG